MPSISNDNVLGTSLSLPFFYNISTNYDLTFTPTIQTKSDDYYSLNYRHLTKNYKLNINSSISNNESKSGTKNHIFVNGAVKNPLELIPGGTPLKVIKPAYLRNILDEIDQELSPNV